MCDWHRYVRENLSVPGLKEARDRDIIADVASQMEDIYSEAKARGRSEEEAQDAAKAHIPDWEAFSDDLVRAERSRRRAMGDGWAEGASESLRKKGGRWEEEHEYLHAGAEYFHTLYSVLSLFFWMVNNVDLGNKFGESG